jgi:hypothetical protein
MRIDMSIITKVSDSKLRRAAGILMVLVLFVGSTVFTGCGNQSEALELAKAGAGTADTMAKYYETLIQDTYDTWDMEAFLLSTDVEAGESAPPISAAERTILMKRVEELNKRIRLARHLASTYNALQELSAYDASGEVEKSAGNLAESIVSLKPLSSGGVDPSKIVGMVAGDITSWKQTKDIRKGSELILEAIEKLHELFEKESEVYKSIPEEKGQKMVRVLTYLIQKEKVTSLPLLQKVPDSLGLKLIGSDTPVKDDQTKNALIEIVKVRGQRNTQLSAMAADGITQALETLASNHRKLQNKNGLSLTDITAAVERANAYIDAISKLKKENEEK